MSHPYWRPNLDGYLARIAALSARESEIADEILSIETDLGIDPMWTYFIRAGAEGPVKIGLSNDVFDRLCNLQVGHHEELRIIRLIRGDAEKAMHRRFHANRIRGEWFKFDPAMMTACVRGTISFRGARLTLN